MGTRGSTCFRKPTSTGFVTTARGVQDRIGKAMLRVRPWGERGMGERRVKGW